MTLSPSPLECSKKPLVVSGRPNGKPFMAKWQTFLAKHIYPRFRPLRASRRPGGYAVTPAPGGRDSHPHGKLSYKVNNYLAVYPEASASFRPTGRTSIKAVLIWQPRGANTALTVSREPHTTRYRTPTTR